MSTNWGLGLGLGQQTQGESPSDQSSVRILAIVRTFGGECGFVDDKGT